MNDTKQSANKNILLGGGFLLMLSWLEILFFWKSIPPKIPWFFSLLWGENQLMNKSGLIWIMGIAILVFLITSYLPGWTKKDDGVIEKTVYIALDLACLLLLLTLTKVLLIFIV